MQSWKQRDYKDIVGRNISFSDENIELIKAFLASQKLFNAAKGLYFIYCALTEIVKNIRGMKTLLRKNREKIVQTIENVEPFLGLKRACRFLKIRFYAWKRKVNCALSPLNECVKQKPINISAFELKMIKIFVQNEQYKDDPLSAIYYKMMRQNKAFMGLTTFYKYAKLFDNVPK